MRRRAWVAAAAAVTFLGCSDSPGSLGSGTGGIALNIVAAGGGGTPLDSGFVRLVGPTNRIAKVTPGTTDTLTGLSPGTYTVALEGYSGGGVSYFGQTTGISVVAGQNTVATVNFVPFVPLLDSIPGYPGDSLGATVYYTTPAGAASFVVEWDTLASFATASSVISLVDSAQFRAARYGVYLVRVRSVDPYQARSPASNSTVVNLSSSVLLTFDFAPNGTGIAPGTVLHSVYQAWGMTLTMGAGTTTSACGTGGPYANSNAPPAGTPDFSGNVVTVCPQGTASDISQNSFGTIQVKTARSARNFCVGIAPDTPSDTAVYQMFNASVAVSNPYFTTTTGQNCTALSGHQITYAFFTGFQNHFARFDNVLFIY